MTLLEFQGWLLIILEMYVCYILTKEFNYDADKYERAKQRKKRKFEFEGLTQGEHR
jgi:hypothetical protein